MLLTLFNINMLNIMLIFNINMLNTLFNLISEWNDMQK